MASKYKKGDAIKSVEELMQQDFVIFQGKVYCKGWFTGWRIGNVYWWIQYQEIYKAIKKTEV